VSLKTTFVELRESALRSDLGRQARLLRRRLTRANSRLLRDYQGASDCRKLQIGGGWRLLDGWLNTDIELVPGIFHMDATKPFPLGDNAFRYVFSEHMIEHIDYASAGSMLRECHRVLLPGGVIRIVTPNLNSLVELLSQPRSGIRQEYYEFFSRYFLPDGHPPTDASVANAFVRSWGHQFIYDEPTLRQLLEGAGFADAVRRRLGESDHAALAGIEHESRYPPGLLDFESIALEATRCAA
jgi:predicted SAM-dependent methyltransferase